MIMKKEINIAKLLKDCQAGTKLYSPIAGEVELLQVTNKYLFFEQEEDRIIVKHVDNHAVLIFTSTGHFELRPGNNSGEVMLFPSKENRSWENFKKNKSQNIQEGRFKIGDVVCTPEGNVGYITEISIMAVTVSNLFDYIGKLNDNQLRFASDEDIDKWNKKLHLSGNHYSKSKKKIIDWFNPFDKVLVRDEYCEMWRCNFFSHYDKSPKSLYPYCCLDDKHFSYCIPYNEKTAHLVGTNDDYKEDEK